VKGIKPLGGAVVNRPETRVDGNSSPRAKKLALQVSNTGLLNLSKGSFFLENCCTRIFVNIELRNL
jgi:hypothetical protein